MDEYNVLMDKLDDICDMLQQIIKKLDGEENVTYYNNFWEDF